MMVYLGKLKPMERVEMEKPEMDNRLNELLNRIEAPGRPGEALSSSEFAELALEVREAIGSKAELLDAYRFVFERKILPDKETMLAFESWQPESGKP
jgi:hypothetical protein